MDIKLTKFKFTTCAIPAFAVLLSGCGGGGGDPTLVGSNNQGGSGTTAQYDYAQGTSSTQASADAALSLLNGTNNGNDFVATTDTNARIAWIDGWTGKNVKVGIADDFNTNNVRDTHGDDVAFVIQSIAPEATYSRIDALGWWPDMSTQEALEYFEANDYHIINASFGIERTDVSEQNFNSRLQSAIANFDQEAENSKQALIIYAAGNSGESCAGRRGEDCDLQQAIVSGLRDAGYTAGEKTIFVSALADGSNEMADYSLIAGDLKNDFLVAHDDVATYGDDSGTSFAAPRVTGAAALVRHKFPNLTSDQLKQVLLQTADDLGDTGVDEIYGHGKLSIVNALSPVGRVVPR